LGQAKIAVWADMDAQHTIGPCRALHYGARQTNCLSCTLKMTHDKTLFVVRQHTIILYNLWKLSNKFEKIVKLTKVKLCFLLLIEISFEVKTQFEYRVTYKSNHIFRNSTKFHRTCFDF
jgi:hypothetical protein